MLEHATVAGADVVLPRAGGEPGWRVLTAADQFGAVQAALRAKGLPIVLEDCGLRLFPLAQARLAP